MSSSTKGVSNTKQTVLNPNAAEFIPSSFRSASSSSKNFHASKPEAGESYGKAVLDRTESATSNNSDDETRQYWRYRLPDDITPDFVDDLLQDSESSLAATPAGLDYSSGSKAMNLMESGQLAYDNLSHRIDPSYSNGDQGLMDNNGINPVELLSTEFPGFAAESLAGIYLASGGDLSLTMEMLTQLEIQEDTGPHNSFAAKSSSAPNLTSMDFPALSSVEMLNGLSQYTEDDVQLSANTYRKGEANKLFFSGSNTNGNSISATDFAAIVRKNASENSGQWKYDRNGTMDVNLGSGRNSQASAGSFAANNRVMDVDRIRSSTNLRQTPQLWLETGDAVANIYSDLREEARDHARVRNAYFEQARQAFIIGNKALAKELSTKGQWHNGLMKAAHEKAAEAIYRQRNQATAHLQNLPQGQGQLIDLHGLHGLVTTPKDLVHQQGCLLQLKSIS
ncbi:hypothetical protein SUGI_0196150 [Cryptomeria japonica]|nr:hypothetical protein SUGI_0196150 [Cryptomeria japonica]